MLCNRDIKLLRYVKKNKSIITGKATHPFSTEEFYNLADQNYLMRRDYSIPMGEREHPLPGKIFTITKRGEAELSDYFRNKLINWLTLLLAGISALTGLLSVILMQ